MMAVSGYSESYCWELEVIMDTHTGQTTITSKKDRILIIDLTSDVPDLSEDLTLPLVDLTLDECDSTCNLTSTPCQDVPLIDLTDDVNIIPVIDLTDDDDSDMMTPSNSQPEWVLHEWEPRDFDSPQSPTYNCNRGMPAVAGPSGYIPPYPLAGPSGYIVPDVAGPNGYIPPAVDGPRSPAPPSSPSSVDSIDVAGPSGYIPPAVDGPRSPPPSSASSVDSIDVGSPFFDIGSPIYIPASPVYDPLGPENGDDSSSSSFNDYDSGYGGMVRED